MATEKLVKAVISGPEDKADEAIRTLVLDRCFHMLPAAAALRGMGDMTPLEDSDPFAETLDAAAALLGRLGMSPAFREFKSRNFTAEDTKAYITDKAAQVARLVTRRTAEDSLVNDDTETLRILAPYGELCCDIGALTSARFLTAVFGGIAADQYPALQETCDRSKNIYLYRTGKTDDTVYCVYLTLPNCADVVAESFAELGFEYMDKPEGAGISGIPAKRIPELQAEISAAREKSEALRQELTRLRETEGDDILARFSFLKYMSSGAKLRGSAAAKSGRFYLAGWLPEAEREQYARDCADLRLDCTFEKPSRLEITKIPVKFRTGFFSKLFAPFVEMYGYPAYGEMDPRIFMTVTYALLFGIMFGDIGQGAVLLLAGLLLKKKGSWLGNILTTVSISSVIFGCVYGSVFGNEHLLPGFKVLEGGNLMTMLIAAVAVGALLIICCGILNIITGFRQHDLKKALFSANGVFGLIFYIGIIAALAGSLALGFDLFGSTLYKIFGIAVPLFCLFCAEPLTELFQGKRDWLPKNVGMFFLTGFFDIYESVLSWFSNTVSFLRVGAYAICHAGMMMVVYLLSGNAIWGLVLGNALVMVVEAVLVCIQVLRLEFYELFGRFYSGQGIPFTPAKVNYSSAA